ncbi:MAG TPA: short-chain dehydrogenase [Gammaproteobacteria bacterium]|nr:short-chain dehydrogenase [Gammaproteobacteria bacterium]
MSRQVVITGGNKGIGLELARAFYTNKDEVTVLCRKSSAALNKLDVNVIENIDVSLEHNIVEARNQLANSKIDIFINNAGIFEHETIDNLNLDNINKQWQVNALAPLVLLKHFQTVLCTGAKIALVTSQMGSIGDNSSGGYYGYRMSKAALNAAGKSLSIDLRSKKISVAILHPGFVRTGMTGGQGNIEPAESAQGLIQCIENLNLSNSGTFWNYRGEILPW